MKYCILHPVAIPQLILKMNSTIFFWCKEKYKMTGITQNGQKSLIFIAVPKQWKQIKKTSTTHYKSDNSMNDESINDNDNENSSITSVIPVNNVFLHHAWTYLNSCFFSLNLVICFILRKQYMTNFSVSCYFLEKEL